MGKKDKTRPLTGASAPAAAVAPAPAAYSAGSAYAPGAIASFLSSARADALGAATPLDPSSIGGKKRSGSKDLAEDGAGASSDEDVESDEDFDEDDDDDFSDDERVLQLRRYANEYGEDEDEDEDDAEGGGAGGARKRGADWMDA
jgi:hypothetical protein